MRPEDFVTEALVLPGFDVRVYRDGAQWVADVPGEDGGRKLVAGGALSSWEACYLALQALDLAEPENDTEEEWDGF